SPEQQRRKTGAETAHQGAEALESSEGMPQVGEQEETARLRSQRAQEIRLQSQESQEGSLPHRGAPVMSGRFISRTRMLVGAVAVLALLGLGFGAAGASASSGWFLINQSFAPTNLAPGKEAAVVINAVNAGYGTIDATTNTITFKDKLPEGVEV